MGFFGSWERELRERSERKSRELRKSIIVGELRRIEEAHPDPRWNLIIERILDGKLEDDTISSLESLVMRMASDPSRVGDYLNEIARLLNIGV